MLKKLKPLLYEVPGAVWFLLVGVATVQSPVWPWSMIGWIEIVVGVICLMSAIVTVLKASVTPRSAA